MVNANIGVTSALVDEFARVVASKERVIYDLETEVSRLRSNNGTVSYSAAVRNPSAEATVLPVSATRNPSSRNTSAKRNTSAARSKSRLIAMRPTLQKVRDSSPKPVFRIKAGDTAGASRAKADLWKVVSKRVRAP